jgi:hypothetical protein
MVRVEKLAGSSGLLRKMIVVAYPAPALARVERRCLIAKADQVEVGGLLAQRDQRLVGRELPAVDGAWHRESG